MNYAAVLLDGLLAGFFSSALGVIFTAPPRYLVPVFFCGFTGRSVRDVLLGWGFGNGWATMVASVAVVLVAAAVIRRHPVSPVALVSGVLPLAASASLFDAILDLIKVSTMKGEALHDAAISLIANAGEIFTTSLAIALGLAAGMAIVRAVRGEKIWDSV